MATLTDAFLADLDALSDGEDDVEKKDIVFKEDEKEVCRNLFLRDTCAVVSIFSRVEQGQGPSRVLKSTLATANTWELTLR